MRWRSCITSDSLRGKCTRILNDKIPTLDSILYNSYAKLGRNRDSKTHRSKVFQTTNKECRSSWEWGPITKLSRGHVCVYLDLSPPLPLPIFFFHFFFFFVKGHRDFKQLLWKKSLDFTKLLKRKYIDKKFTRHLNFAAYKIFIYDSIHMHC